MAGPAEKLYLRADAEIVTFLFLVVAFAADDFKKRLRLCIEDFPKNVKAAPRFWVDLTASDEKCACRGECTLATNVVVVVVIVRVFFVLRRVAVYVMKARYKEESPPVKCFQKGLLEWAHPEKHIFCLGFKINPKLYISFYLGATARQKGERAVGRLHH